MRFSAVDMSNVLGASFLSKISYSVTRLFKYDDLPDQHFLYPFPSSIKSSSVMFSY